MKKFDSKELIQFLSYLNHQAGDTICTTIETECKICFCAKLG